MESEKRQRDGEAGREGDVMGEKQDGKMASETAKREEQTMSEMGEKSEQEEMGEMTKREAGKMTERDESKRADEGMVSEGEEKSYGTSKTCGTRENELDNMRVNEELQQIADKEIRKPTARKSSSIPVIYGLSYKEIAELRQTLKPYSTKDAIELLDSNQSQKQNISSSPQRFRDQMINGFIYLIINTLNLKCYIGQTVKTIEERWREHVHTAKAHSGYKPLIDSAIDKYGIDAFQCVAIEQLYNCPRWQLDKRERYWIAYFQCCVLDYGIDAGYNVSRGGGGNLYKLSFQDELEIVRLHNEQHTYEAISEKFGISPSTIVTVLRKHGVPARTEKERSQLTRCRLGFQVEQYDNNHSLIRQFDSIREASRWIISHSSVCSQTNSCTTEQSVARQITRAVCLDETLCGYHWNISSWSDQEKQRRREQLKNRRRTKPQPKCYCTVCGCPISANATYCQRHNPRRQRAIYFQKHILGGIEVTKEQLLQLLRFYTMTEIGKMFNVSSAAVKKFARKHFNIVSQRYSLYRLWNDEYQCYEYMEVLPFSLDDLYEMSSTPYFLYILANTYRISRNTLINYISKAFGRDISQEMKDVSAQHRSIYDWTTGYRASNITVMARHLLEQDDLSYSYEAEKLASKISYHLIIRKQSSYIYNRHVLSLQQAIS